MKKTIIAAVAALTLMVGLVARVPAQQQITVTTNTVYTVRPFFVPNPTVDQTIAYLQTNGFSSSAVRITSTNLKSIYITRAKITETVTNADGSTTNEQVSGFIVRPVLK